MTYRDWLFRFAVLASLLGILANLDAIADAQLAIANEGCVEETGLEATYADR